MKLQAQNKLAHYQAEYQELSQQTQMLQGQLPAMEKQLQFMLAYLNENSGDRKVRADYSNLLRKYNALSNTIKRNCMRLNTLSRQIATENQKIMAAQQRQMASAYRRANRSPNYYY